MVSMTAMKIIIGLIKVTVTTNNSNNKLYNINTRNVCLFVFLALQPTGVVFSQPGSGL